VCATSAITDQEISDVTTKFFDAVPFRWLVDVQDKHQIQKLENNRFTFVCSYPGMILDINELPVVTYGSDVSVKEINNAEDIKQWIDIVAASYGSNAHEFSKFITYLQENCSPGTLRFYCGYYDGKPVATTVTIQHDDVVGVHWVGTLPEYRGKGVGYAVTHASLLEAKHKNCTQAILLASEMGKPIYAKMGFKEFAMYNVYKRD
jgi:GNAT superfamily N-acetyltransferase